MSKLVVRSWKNICNILDCGNRKTAKKKIMQYEKKYKMNLLHKDGDGAPFIICAQMEEIFNLEINGKMR